MDKWKEVWRRGFAPQLSTAGLVALRGVLESDDPRLVQGTTTVPPPLTCMQDWPVEGGCAVAIAAWLGDGVETVGEVEEQFAKVCFEADQLLGEPAACRWYLNWFDDTPRTAMRRELLAEVEEQLKERLHDSNSAASDATATDECGARDGEKIYHRGFVRHSDQNERQQVAEV